ncbi:hypothetical protein RND81_13G073700 [Saponaria officinalis]|uniref:U-box domain-containing protein n=1 Tax=Saponaria officinalis TaxID=3572 RepID=A0AAW1GX20_SAPOF
MDQQEVEVPQFFICPISLQIMRDPVTLSTGITYDRESIEHWLFSNNNNTCPITKQPLNDQTTEIFLTPNHTLRRLIQSWCTLNASYGVERFPTPKPPTTKTQILKLIRNASNSPQCLLNCLEKLKSIVVESSANKRVFETTPQVIEFLARLIIVDNNDQSQEIGNNVGNKALSILSHLHITDVTLLKALLAEKEGTILNSLATIMQKSNDECRTYAINLMKLLVQVVEPNHVVSIRVDNFVEVVQLLKDNVSPKASKAALKFLAVASTWGRNRVRAVEAGAVHVMVNQLLELKEKRTTEMVLDVLDTLCGCAEGRAELLSHGAGLAVVSKKILRVSHFASEKGVKILYAIAKFSGSLSVVQEMVQLGVVTKLCVILQVECDAKTKEKARDVLRLHGKVWSDSPCAPMHVLRSLSC